MFMPEEVEAEDGFVKLQQPVTQAAAEGLPPEGVDELKGKVMQLRNASVVEVAQAKVHEITEQRAHRRTLFHA